jgi:hypothetical protein
MLALKRRPRRRSKRKATALAQKAFERLARKTPAHKSEHLKAALTAAEQAGKVRSRYNTYLERAITKYGDVTDGKFISGIYNEHFPEAVKNKLRALNAEVNKHTDNSVAAYRKSGKRKPWRFGPLRDIAISIPNDEPS